MSSEGAFDRPCQDMGNAYPFCAPLSTDTWYEGSQYQFVWNYNYPLYVTANQLDLHLYYKKNYAYTLITSWNNLTTTDGSLTVTVDESWFPTPDTSGNNVTWTMYGYYLPAGMNATEELVDVSSLYPRPFNFSVVQIYNASDVTATNNSNSSNVNSSNSGSNNSGGLPGWAIAVIVIACVLFVIAVAALIWGILYLRRRSKQGSEKTFIERITEQRNMSERSAGIDAAMRALPTSTYDTTSIRSNTPMITAARGGGGGTSPRHSDTTEFGSVASRPSSPGDPTVFQNLFHPSSEDAEEELRRRKLGEALLQRELAEEGASVKHAERRALTIRTAAPELGSQAVILERRDSDLPQPQ